MAAQDTDWFPDREDLLAGVPARRADTLLFLIESRTAHQVARSRRAMERFVSEEAIAERELAFFEAFARGREPAVAPTVQDLEHHAWQWAPLVPPSPRVRAALAERLGRKYRFTYRDVPGIRRALGLDDPDVRAAYRRLHGRALGDIFASRGPVTDRARWAWAAVGARIARLTPFWTAYALTLTETVGATTLALPIAVATVGPLAGVVVLVVLGLVNVVTVAYMAEAVTRSGTIRYGSSYLGRLVADYLGPTGSAVVSVALFVLCLLALTVFYLGISTVLESATSIGAPVWVAVVFAIGVHYLRRESLDATVASALTIGAVNIALLLTLIGLGLAHVQVDNLLHVDVPFVAGRPFDPSVLQVIFGVILAAYFGHSSVNLCGRLVLRRDPTGRSLLWGCVAAQITAIVVYSLFVVAVNGAVAPQVLAAEAGTAVSPLAAEVGPLAAVLGSMFAVLGMGMGTIHFSLALSGLTRERLPSQTSPVLLLPRQRARLWFEERRFGRTAVRVRIGVTYVGRRDGAPAFRVEAVVRGETQRIETTAIDALEILGPKGLPSLVSRFDELRGTGHRLGFDVVDAAPQHVRLMVRTSLRTRMEGAWDDVGLGLSDVLELTDAEGQIVGWIVRQGEVTAGDLARHVGADEVDVGSVLSSLVDRGLIRETDGGSRYVARMAARRGRALPDELTAVLTDDDADSANAGVQQDASPSSGARSVLLGRRGRVVVGAVPVVLSFALAEWMLVTGSGSFTGLLGFIGVVVVSVVAGIFPVLLLYASRLKGEYVPATVNRLLGRPVLLVGLYLLFLGSILLHGVVIWTDLWLRAGALAVGAAIVVLTVRMARSGAFARRLNIEVRDQQGRTAFAVTTAGRELRSAVTLEYPDGVQHLDTAAGDIPSFASLRRAVFEPRGDRGAMPEQLKVWCHRVTPDGTSGALAASLTVRTDGGSEHVDMELVGGQVTLPLRSPSWRVDIEL